LIEEGQQFKLIIRMGIQNGDERSMGGKKIEYIEGVFGTWQLLKVIVAMISTNS